MAKTKQKFYMIERRVRFPVSVPEARWKLHPHFIFEKRRQAVMAIATHSAIDNRNYVCRPVKVFVEHDTSHKKLGG